MDNLLVFFFLFFKCVNCVRCCGGICNNNINGSNNVKILFCVCDCFIFSVFVCNGWSSFFNFVISSVCLDMEIVKNNRMIKFLWNLCVKM